MRSFILVCAGLTALAAADAQTTVQGGTTFQGSVGLGSPYTRNVQIMALFPPGVGTADYAPFYANVMTQPSVDGVTLAIDWSTVETSAPIAPPCAVSDDRHQTDAVGQCHTYDWSAYDSATSATGIWTWFTPFTVGGVSRLKKVNLVLVGIGTGGGIDALTPWYVTSAAYSANFAVPYNRQDVLNTFKDCLGLPWSGKASSPSITFSRSGTTVTVYSPGCCKQDATTIHNGDLVYVNSVSDATYNVLGVTASRISDDSFSYAASAGPNPTCSNCTYISQGWSSPVPYEQPYTAAWKAFVTAAILHFGAGYSANSTVVGAAGTNQIGYIRAGTWTGGESFVYCVSSLAGLAAPYTFSSSTVWLLDYQGKVKYMQGLLPESHSYWSINQVGSDLSYPATEASYATSAANAFGIKNAFGSQGLSLLDVPSDPPPCASGSSSSDWCFLFGQYHLFGMPLELQQLSISDPTNQTCGSGCNAPPGVSGDLRLWLPYAVSNYVTTLELYYRDLGLAFDPYYCTAQSGGACTAGYSVQSNSNITTTQEWQWFSAGNGGSLSVGVGQGSHCNPSVTSSIGAGDCSYAIVINNAHGLH